MSTQNINNKTNWKEREIGAIWSKDGKLSGYIKNKQGKEIRIILFKNNFKENQSHPEYKIYLAFDKSSPNKPEPKKIEPEQKNTGDFV